MRVYFEVSLELPSGASRAEIREYILEQVMAGCGGLHPEDPIFHLDRKSVRVIVRGLKTAEKA